MEGLLLAFMFIVFFVIVVFGYVYNTFLRFKQKGGNQFLNIFILVMGMFGFMIWGGFAASRNWSNVLHSMPWIKPFAIVCLIGFFELSAGWLEIIEFRRGIHSKFHKYLAVMLLVLVIIVIIS
ncbi:hypothetical protein [uncultured Methanobrevibacter sp.]|uniref:hypothetical protein n=1 Tax=uncultured Methanobrevibacter sp. TaxID=253161 RepID=UPI0026072575|nr:hypothetical protein [uncultured Methanobrevibacter sp.]